MVEEQKVEAEHAKFGQHEQPVELHARDPEHTAREQWQRRARLLELFCADRAAGGSRVAAGRARAFGAAPGRRRG